MCCDYSGYHSFIVTQNRSALLTAAGEMGATGGQLLMLAEETEVDIKIQEALVSMAKAVASATAALVSNARNVADKCEDEALQNQVIVAAKQVGSHYNSPCMYILDCNC